MGIDATALGLIFLLLLPLALLPTIIAVARNHPHKIPIVLVNVLGGLFYGLGKIGVRSCIPTTARRPQLSGMASWSKKRDPND